MKKDKFDTLVDKAIETAHKVEQKSALKEIEAKLVAKKMEFKQLKERERILESELEKTNHDIIKTAGAYNALVDLKKTLSLKEGYEQQKKELAPKQKQIVKKNLKKINPKAIKAIKKASTKTRV